MLAEDVLVVLKTTDDVDVESLKSSHSKSEVYKLKGVDQHATEEHKNKYKFKIDTTEWDYMGVREKCR